MSDLPTVVSSSGLQPTAPATLRAMLLALVEATNPGYTANLPGTLIEDIASTDVGALVLADQARVDLVNSISPLTANDYVALLLGQQMGLTLGQPTNTSVDLTFTATDQFANPLPGLTIPPGFTVSDGTYQYSVTDGAITGSAGTASGVSARATQTGTWVVPAHSVVNIVSSVPSVISLAVDNPLAGTPGGAQETLTAFRARAARANLAASVGMTRYLRTLLDDVTGVQDRLVGVRQVGSGWQVIVGGAGDNYAVALAVSEALGASIPSLVGSSINVTGITQADPGVVTTDLYHGYRTGDVVTITGIVGMAALNGVPLTITFLTNTTFSIGIDTSGYPDWVSGGVCEPNPRNVPVTVVDYPDTYVVPLVVPPQMTIAVTLTWNTDEVNFVQGALVAQLGSPAIVDYINSIPVGYPFNALDALGAFKGAVASVLPAQFLTRAVFDVLIDGETVTPLSGTYAYQGDLESYFYTTASSVVVQQG